ncbi:MAG: cytosine permease [Desulfurococcales archaeon]|nr:cytosine permease [Desulfurococcales archaeon]
MGSGEAGGGLGPLGFALVMFSMASCLPLFFLGPIAYHSGLTLGQALAAALAGNTIVAAAMALNGHAGVARRIGFPEQAREVFGTAGAKLAVALRGLVGALWYGVEAYNGALALLMIALIALHYQGDTLEAAARLLPLSLALYLASMLLVLRGGVERIGRAATLAGPLMLAYFAWLAWWLHSRGAQPGAAPEGVPWTSLAFLGYLAIQTNWWATVAVNMSDLSRAARSWGAVWAGVLLGMVGGQLLGTYLGYQLALMTGESLPQEIVADYAPGLAAVLLGLAFAFLAPWTTDLTANVPALMDILTEAGLTWRRAALAAALLGFLLAPWWALDRAQDIVGYVTSFAASYGVILGPLLGPMLASYWLLGRGRTAPAANPHPRRVYPAAVAAFLVGVAASYLASVAMGAYSDVSLAGHTVRFPGGLTWYVGVAASLLAYPPLARLQKRGPAAGAA